MKKPQSFAVLFALMWSLTGWTNQGIGQVAVPEEALAFDPSQAVQAGCAVAWL